MDRDLLLIATALDEPSEDSREALAELLARDVDGALARRHRVSSALALRVSRSSDRGAVSGPKAYRIWRQRMRAVSAQQMHLEAAMAELGEVLGQVPWIPIKGMDLCSRVYDPPEERPTSDLDVLVASADFDRARDRLRSAGWKPLNAGPRSERYVRQEGYAWQARNAAGALLELHYRLWGLVGPEVADALVAAAEPDPSLPGAGRRLRLDHAYLVAAVHLWLDPPPRAACAFRDLERIGRRGPTELGKRIVAEADRFDLQLPVLWAAEVTYRLWAEPTNGAVVDGLQGRLRPVERWWWKRVDDPSAVSLSKLVLARHLSRRRARHGLGRNIWRRLWAHPGIVEQATHGRWPWIGRRIWYQCSIFGWERPAAWLSAWMKRRVSSGDRISPEQEP